MSRRRYVPRTADQQRYESGAPAVSVGEVDPVSRAVFFSNVERCPLGGCTRASGHDEGRLSGREAEGHHAGQHVRAERADGFIAREVW